MDQKEIVLNEDEVQIELEINPPKKANDFDHIKKLLRNKPFTFLILANTILFLVVGAVQYWATFYFINVLKQP